MVDLAIYGASGHGRETAWLAEDCATEGTPYVVRCFVDDDVSRQGQRVNEIEVKGFEAVRRDHPDARFVVAVGSPELREKLAQRVEAAGGEFETLVHPRVERSRFVDFGRGVAVCAGSIVTTNVSLGDFVQINIDCTVSHDCVLEAYATLAPGVHVCGCVKIGRRAYIGAGATIINGTLERPLIIGDDAVIGAGACVVGDIPAGVTAVGVPAKAR